MRDLNKIVLLGRLGADPIRRETHKGTTVVHFPLATGKKIVEEETGTVTTKTQWHHIVCWGKQGQWCADALKKGSAVYLEGELRSHEYETQDGLKKRAYEIHASEINFLKNPMPASSSPSLEVTL